MTCPGCDVQFAETDDGNCLYLGHLCQRKPLNAPCERCGELTDYRVDKICQPCKEEVEREYWQGLEDNKIEGGDEILF